MSVMKQLNVDENIAKTINRKVAKLLIITSCAIIVAIYGSDSIIDDQNWQLLQTIDVMVKITALVAYKLMKCILSFVCRCFIISICDLITAELEKMEKEIKEAKSPYKAMKLIKSSIIKYQKLQNLSKSMNVLFSVLLLTGFITSIMPVAFIIATVLCPNHYRWNPHFFTVDYLLFVLSLTALYSASQVNSKKRNLISAFRDRVVAQNPLDTVDVMKLTICLI
ncbi:hypothetical protein CHUAL_012160 [Chamberlinius hualienensis]